VAEEAERSLAGADRAIGALAGRQNGVVARWQLDRIGVGRRKVDSRLARGSLHRLHQGVYAVGHRALTIEGRWLAAVIACGPDALLSHRPAGQLWGLLSRSAVTPGVTRPGSFRARPGIAIHRSAVPPDEAGVLRGIPVTSLSRTLLDLAAVLPKRGVERALNEAEVRGLTDSLSLPDLLARYPRRRGAATLRALLAARTPGGITRNDFEERFVAFLDGHGLPRPRFNATLPIRGRLLEVDCMWREERLIVELDGRATHGTDRAFESDRRRDRLLVAEGWRATRVTWRQLRDEPGEIAADLRGLLRAPPRA
jgi:very-short-patch-repair endonuclease